MTGFLLNNKTLAVKIILCTLMPAALGYSNTLMSYIYDNIKWDFITNNQNLISNFIQIIIFYWLIKIILDNTLYYSNHKYKFLNISINSLSIYLWLSIIIILALIVYKQLWGQPIYSSINLEIILLSVILGPILEGITAQSVFTVIDDKKYFFTLCIIVISSISFAIMHCPKSDINLTSLINNEVTINEFLQKYLQHFIYNLYLSLCTLYFKRIDVSIFLHAAQNASYFI